MIQLEELTVCHLGDLAAPLTAEELTRIKDSDVLLVPVGGHCTINAAQAAEIVCAGGAEGDRADALRDRGDPRAASTWTTSSASVASWAPPTRRRARA